jgi:hypothetical protein
MFPTELYMELLHTGKFGTVQIGADEPDVRQTTGYTEEDWGAPSERPRVLGFRNKHLRVDVSCGLVVYFGVNFRPLRRPIVLAGIELSVATSVDEFGEWLRREGIGYRYRNEPSVELRLDSGVTACFDRDNVFDSLQVSDPNRLW